MFISIEFAGNLIPSMRGSCTTIYWLFIIDQNLLREVFMTILAATLLFEIYVVVFDMELLIFENIIASFAHTIVMVYRL